MPGVYVRIEEKPTVAKVEWMKPCQKMAALTFHEGAWNEAIDDDKKDEHVAVCAEEWSGMKMPGLATFWGEREWMREDETWLLDA
jgi:hypothetical protein